MNTMSEALQSESINSVNHRVFERTLRPLVFRGACLSERHCCPQARLVCWAAVPPGTGPKGSGGTASGPRAYGALSPALQARPALADASHRSNQPSLQVDLGSVTASEAARAQI
ncbi:hypothetical protein EYZ11_013145 [Aspergillus tanneri]|uniref:Uncharacterized protein n=1 Tax=Aspergillus tanneri TaxID=1220188 RepID=A0A4S3IYE1_9EURO|nr:hypothetical protein EYZ11_013145 [Aspergillus tanneri]